ncbi:MurR/RpiR family transcriptional regulator, partial [Salmonella enterica]|nr:MurR/RpiR family transcriptional regulator [Salmonella enterica]
MESQPPRLKPGKILYTLGAVHKSLTRASQRIAQYILAFPSQVTQSSIADF